MIVDVSYLQWLCLQFPIYISSQGLLGCTGGGGVLAVDESSKPCSGERGWGPAWPPDSRMGCGLHPHQRTAPTLLGETFDKLKLIKCCCFTYFIHFKRLSTIFLFLEGSLSLPPRLQPPVRPPRAPPQAGTDTRDSLGVRMATMHFTPASSVYKEGCFPQLLYFLK